MIFHCNPFSLQNGHAKSFCSDRHWLLIHHKNPQPILQQGGLVQIQASFCSIQYKAVFVNGLVGTTSLQNAQRDAYIIYELCCPVLATCQTFQWLTGQHLQVQHRNLSGSQMRCSNHCQSQTWPMFSAIFCTIVSAFTAFTSFCGTGAHVQFACGRYFLRIQSIRRFSTIVFSISGPCRR